MAVTELDVFQISNEAAPATFPVSAGAARWALVGVPTFDGSDASPASGVTLGGQAMTRLGIADAAGSDATVTVWGLDDAGLQARADDSLSISGLPAVNFAVIYGSIQDADQTAPSGTALAEAHVNSASGSATLERVADSFTLLVQGHDSGGNFSSSSDPTIESSSSPNGAYRAAYAAVTDTARTADYTWSHTFGRDDTVVLLNFAPASGGSSPTISSHPASVQPGDTVDVTVSDSAPITGATFAGVDVYSTATKPDSTTLRYTVPSAYDNGLGFKSQTFEITDGSTPDSTSTTLNVPSNVDYSGTVSGYDALPSGQYSLWDDSGISVVDGDKYIKRDTSALISTSTDSGADDFSASGDVYIRVLDVSDSTDGPDGTWTEERTVTVQETDTTAPTVSSVDVPTAGSYKAGDDLDFTVNWDEAATVTGTPALNLTIGGSSRQANYVSGSGSTALLFRYTIQAGDNDADGISVNSLTLDGGTIQDAAGNNATLTLNSVGDTSGVLVDTVKPVITPNGSNPATVVVGESYTDADATATDDQDGSLGPVAGTGTVDTNTVGQYIITYPGAGIVDSAGNVADDATRTVNVVAELPPIPTRKKRNRRIVRKSIMLGAWRNRFTEDDENGR